MADVTEQDESLQNRFTSVIKKVGRLQSRIQSLEDATTSARVSASADAHYYSGEGSFRVRNTPEAVVGWLLIGSVVVLLL